jgi:hypothetical protein
MQLPIFEKYIDELIEKSTLDVPAWNIEKAREGKAAGWNYIDGCMIIFGLCFDIQTKSSQPDKMRLDSSLTKITATSKWQTEVVILV